jgi:syntaxin 16
LYIVSLLQNEQQKRLVINFDDEEISKLNKNITKIVISITSQLKSYEKLIKEFSKQNMENGIINNIKLNMQQLLFNKFSEFTKKFKLNQEIHKQKYKELIGEEDPTYQIQTSSKNDNNNDANNTLDNFLMTTDNTNLQLVKRDKDLDNLLNSVNDLAEIFKDMQTLVMEQGSILDRIDYNIDVASTNVLSGKKSIEKADKYHKNNCFRNVIIILIVCIFIEGLLLIFKFL